MASIDKRPNGKYLARWREYPGADQRTKTFARKEDARQHLVKVQHDLMSGSYVDPSKSRTTVEEYYKVWSARQPWRPSTRRAVAKQFRCARSPGFGGRPHWQRAPGRCGGVGRQAGHGRRTAGIRVQHLSAMFEAAVADTLLAKIRCGAPSDRQWCGSRWCPSRGRGGTSSRGPPWFALPWTSGRCADFARVRPPDSASTGWTSCAGS